MTTMLAGNVSPIRRKVEIKTVGVARGHQRADTILTETMVSETILTEN